MRVFRAIGLDDLGGQGLSSGLSRLLHCCCRFLREVHVTRVYGFLFEGAMGFYSGAPFNLRV